jgi:hypothetical protein
VGCPLGLAGLAIEFSAGQCRHGWPPRITNVESLLRQRERRNAIAANVRGRVVAASWALRAKAFLNELLNEARCDPGHPQHLLGAVFDGPIDEI